MIVLPNTPQPISASLSLPPNCLAPRANLLGNQNAPSDPTRFILNATEYLDSIFAHLYQPGLAVDDLVQRAKNATVSSSIPWSNIQTSRLQKKFHVTTRPQLLWTLLLEIQATTVAIAFAYMQVAAEVTNELIDAAPDSDLAKESAEKWRSVAGFYKKAMSFARFGSTTAAAEPLESLDARVFVLLDRIASISTQMSLLCKYSAANRQSYNVDETFSSTNNGVLCRVAIYVAEETQGAVNMVHDVETAGGIVPTCAGWASYLALIKRYGCAYAGLFFLIEHYQKNSLGHAIGLINYALVCLQSRRFSEVKPTRKKILSRVTSKIANKRNEAFVTNLHSTTTLDLDKSNFQQLSGIVLKDIALLFDQLVQCHLKYTKENDNLQFDAVSDWKDVKGDSRWPFGCKLPQEEPAAFVPGVLRGESEGVSGYY